MRPTRLTFNAAALFLACAWVLPGMAADSATETVFSLNDGTTIQGQLYGYADGEYQVSRPFGRGMFVSVPVAASGVLAATAPHTIDRVLGLLAEQRQVLHETGDIVKKTNLILEAQGRKLRPDPAQEPTLPELAWDIVVTTDETLTGEVSLLSATGLVLRSLDEGGQVRSATLPIARVQSIRTANRLGSLRELEKQREVLERERDREAAELEKAVEWLHGMIADLKKQDSRPAPAIQSEPQIQLPASGSLRLRVYNMNHRGGPRFQQLANELAWYYELAERERLWRLQQYGPEEFGGEIHGPDSGRQE